jgi:hypothetical protein
LKKEIIHEAEKLSRSTDWKATPNQFKFLFQQFRNIGSVPNDYYKKLNDQFKSAQDLFYQNRDYQFSLIDQINIEKKQQIIEKAKCVTNRMTEEQAKGVFKILNEDWRAIKSSKNRKHNELWNYFKSIQNNYFDYIKKLKYEKKQADQKKFRIQKKWNQIERMEQVATRTIDQIKRKEEYQGRLTEKLRKKTHAYGKWTGAPDWELHNKYDEVTLQIEELRRKLVDIDHKIYTLKQEVRQI